MTFKDSLHSVSLAIGLIGSVYTAWVLLSSNVVTRNDLVAHDASIAAHADLRTSINTCNSKVSLLEQRVEESREEAINMAAVLVRTAAAEAELDRTLKMAAANYYEQQFRRLIRSPGANIDDARIDALNQPWYTKPRK